MNGSQSDGNGDGTQDAERLRRLRLSEAEGSGEITGRMGDVLERLLGTTEDPEAAQLRKRLGAVRSAWRVWRRA